jgi:hypothetical protein
MGTKNMKVTNTLAYFVSVLRTDKKLSRGTKNMKVTNTLAYFVSALVTKKKVL